jgi:hypothetical protein
MSALRLLLALLALTAAACGTVKANADAAVDDAAADDANGTAVDGGLDAPPDGRPVDLCATVCPAVVTCFGEDTLNECFAACAADSADCTAAEQAALIACADGGCAGLETCLGDVACLEQSATCGDGSCGDGEDCGSCELDCGPCELVCGDAICSPEWGENCVACEADCGACPFVCGDGACSGELGESCGLCPGDCGACLTCGDGICSNEILERCENCPGDCGACVCGDAICSVGECTDCNVDCPDGCNCPHDTCTTGVALDPGCGSCAATLCQVDPYCCLTYFDAFCLGESESICGLDCPASCGDAYCDALENTKTCPNDCPPS